MEDVDISKEVQAKAKMRARRDKLSQVLESGSGKKQWVALCPKSGKQPAVKIGIEGYDESKMGWIG